MTVQIVTPNADQWPAMAHVDGRSFGNFFHEDELPRIRETIDLSRFRIALDGPEVVGVSGSFALDVTVPGGSTIPMGGVTWVSVAATHRRQGVLTRMIHALHDDIESRGEPIAMLGSSEGGIYERFGYGICTRSRVTEIDRRLVQLRPEFVPEPGAVWYLDGDDAREHVAQVWPRFHRLRASEVTHSDAWHDMLAGDRSTADAPFSKAVYLAHRDGYAVYRITQEWNNGRPTHRVVLNEMVAITDEAHSALWYTVLSLDLVGVISSRQIPIDDPLPFKLTNQRMLRTVDLNDGYWANVLDVAICFGARRYGTEDRLVIEVDGGRWAIDGTPTEASCSKVRSKPDLICDHAAIGSLLFGGESPVQLAAGRRISGSKAALQRAEAFFRTAPAPHCQTQY